MAGGQKKGLPSQTKTIHTIDEKHSELIQHYTKIDNETIPQLQKEKDDLKTHIRTLKEGQIDEYMSTKDKIKEIQEKVKKLKYEKKRYFLDNSQFIFDYFEQKQQISSSTEYETGSTDALNNFFKIKSNETINDGIINKYTQSKKNTQQYWRNVTNEFTNAQDYYVESDTCEYCKLGEMIPQDEEGILICNNNACGKFVTYIIDSSKPNNKDPPNEVSYTAYIRLNHFKEILSQFQAKETTQIPEEVIDAIKARIKKERITDLTQLNYDKMRELLRKLGLNKYFEHIQYINSLFGIKPPVMNEELHETLCVLFIEIQKPWAVHCPANRTNFFNYTYTLHQLCVLLDQTQYLPYIPMMKDREKQLEQDMIWKKVCEDLDWEFFASV
tara:strand:- start:1780 stop:2934 length:1155 start_codon:yes stop_codon:yes gene_type:complete